MGIMCSVVISVVKSDMHFLGVSLAVGVGKSLNSCLHRTTEVQNSLYLISSGWSLSTTPDAGPGDVISGCGCPLVGWRHRMEGHSSILIQKRRMSVDQ